jgi:hypothetical protein
MASTYTIANIALVTDLESERLRYVIDQQLLPGARRPTCRTGGRGIPRLYTPFEAFGLSCAAFMISAGLRRQRVAQCFDLLCRVPKKSPRSSNTLLQSAFDHHRVTHLEVGDDVNLRFRSTGISEETKSLVEWHQIATGATVVDFAPWVSISIDIQKVRKLFHR